MAVAQRLERLAQLFVKGHAGNRFEVMGQSEYRQFHPGTVAGSGRKNDVSRTPVLSLT